MCISIIIFYIPTFNRKLK